MSKTLNVKHVTGDTPIIMTLKYIRTQFLIEMPFPCNNIWHQNSASRKKIENVDIDKKDLLSF